MPVLQAGVGSLRSKTAPTAESSMQTVQEVGAADPLGPVEEEGVTDPVVYRRTLWLLNLEIGQVFTAT